MACLSQLMAKKKNRPQSIIQFAMKSLRNIKKKKPMSIIIHPTYDYKHKYSASSTWILLPDFFARKFGITDFNPIYRIFEELLLHTQTELYILYSITRNQWKSWKEVWDFNRCLLANWYSITEMIITHIHLQVMTCTLH